MILVRGWRDRVWRSVIFAVALVVIGKWAGGQQSASPVPTIQTTVRQVLVPVLVTDKKGRPVSHLRESDFAVFEDDAPQRIAAFRTTYDASLEAGVLPGEREAGRGTAASAVQQVGPESPMRTYLVCVDTLHSSFGNVTQARRALTKFFHGERDPRAQYALMNLGRKIEVIQDSTRDPALVLAALGNKKFQSGVLDSEASNLALAGEQLRQILQKVSPQACRAPAVRVRGTIPDNCAAVKEQAKLFITTHAEQTSLLTRAYLQELQMVINATAEIPTERTLILISDGFNLVPGRELFGIAAAYFPDDPEWRSNDRDTQPQLGELLRLAQRQNVIIYTLDSRGLYSPASRGGNYDAANSAQANVQATNELDTQANTVAWEQGSAMAQLAAATGGVYFHDNNNLLAGLRRAFDDGRQRYLIAYSPSNTTVDGKYRRIRVVLKDKDLRAQAKAGYWATEK